MHFSGFSTSSWCVHIENADDVMKFIISNYASLLAVLESLFQWPLFIQDESYSRPRPGSGMRDKSGRGRGRGRYPRVGREERHTQKDEEEARILAAVSHFYGIVSFVSHECIMSSFVISHFFWDLLSVNEIFAQCIIYCRTMYPFRVRNIIVCKGSIANKDAWVCPAWRLRTSLSVPCMFNPAA